MIQLRESILKVVAYFDLFNYPVTLEEIRHFLDQPVHGDVLPAALKSLLDKQLLWQHGQHYSCRNDPQLVERRKQGNQMAVKQLKKAMRVGRVLSWFPYVRGVGISGSLSKNIAYKGSDLDFFIITAANRLWIARFFLFLLAKTVKFFVRRHFFCLNYYVDEQALEIEEQNIFTAIEIITLLPACGQQGFQSFFSSNQWVNGYLPNGSFRELPAKGMSRSVIKRVMEWGMNNRLGDRLDNWLMERFSAHWKVQRTLNKFTSHNVPLGAFVSEKHICKPMPHYYQQRILGMFQEKIDQIQAQYTLVAD